MRVSTFSAAAAGDNEDWVSASPSLIVVVDGGTARTETGCAHGVAWYAATLGTVLSSCARDASRSLPAALALAIGQVAGEHRGCDLSHPGTPSAAVAVLRMHAGALEYLVLSDITVVLETPSGLRVLTDDRVDGTSREERAAADRLPIGSPEKDAALLVMKRAELAARNRPGGFWVAAADPAVATEALTGSVPLTGLRRVAVLTDGAARIVKPFELLGWPELLDVLDGAGPEEVVRRVRAAEAADPQARRWPRNKRSDDATIAYAART